MSDAAVDVPGRRAAFLPASAVRRLNDAIEALIALADELAPDCDLEEDDPPGDDAGPSSESADMEPSLATEAMNQESAWKATAGQIDAEFNGDGVADPDLEEGHDLEDAKDDEEPSLAATNDINQEYARLNSTGGGEAESDGFEDELGAACVTREQSEATRMEKRRLEDLLRGRQSGDDGEIESGRMFRPDEIVRMPDGTRIMGYV